MMADSIEHVISYWVIFQKFQSPALAGFAVVGALSDRFDPRRITQIGMLIFMGVSLAWGVLFVTDTLQVWHAIALLVLSAVLLTFNSRVRSPA
jgi:MFS family permease